MALCTSYYPILNYKNAHRTSPGTLALFVIQSVTISCTYVSCSTEESRIKIHGLISCRKKVPFITGCEQYRNGMLTFNRNRNKKNTSSAGIIGNAVNGQGAAGQCDFDDDVTGRWPE
jgi:hypothetical protein